MTSCTSGGRALKLPLNFLEVAFLMCLVSIPLMKRGPCVLELYTGPLSTSLNLSSRVKISLSIWFMFVLVYMVKATEGLCPLLEGPFEEAEGQ